MLHMQYECDNAFLNLKCVPSVRKKHWLWVQLILIFSSCLRRWLHRRRAVTWPSHGYYM